MVWDSAMRRMDAAGTAWASLGRNGPNCLTICLSEYDDDADELTFSSRKTCKTCTCGREEGGRACSGGGEEGMFSRKGSLNEVFERLNELVGKVQRESEGASLVHWLVEWLVGSQTIRFHSKRWDGNSVFDHLAWRSCKSHGKLASYSATLQGRGRIPPCVIERDVRRG